MNPQAAGWIPNWDEIRLVVFDVDGTLYDQRGLRFSMLSEMLVSAVRSRDAGFIRILRAYRGIREQLGDALQEEFEKVLVARTAAAADCGEDLVRSTVAEWLERRPLRHLVRYRYPGLIELFQGLRGRGKIIGVLSDYPAANKLQALKLEADIVVCAGDEGVGVLKPHPRGVQVLMSRAAMQPGETILIGDRPERDGLAAQAANVNSLIRSRRPIAGWRTFDGYEDPLFSVFALSE